jgi:hypothetical protein
VEKRPIELRKLLLFALYFLLHLSWKYRLDMERGKLKMESGWLMTNRGYVALAVATESGTYKRELSTGLGGDREANMIAFAVEALVLLRDVIKGEAEL